MIPLSPLCRLSPGTLCPIARGCGAGVRWGGAEIPMHPWILQAWLGGGCLTPSAQDPAPSARAAIFE